MDFFRVVEHRNQKALITLDTGMDGSQTVVIIRVIMEKEEYVDSILLFPDPDVDPKQWIHSINDGDIANLFMLFEEGVEIQEEPTRIQDDEIH